MPTNTDSAINTLVDEVTTAKDGDFFVIDFFDSVSMQFVTGKIKKENLLENFANKDLVFNGNRVHDADVNSFRIENLLKLSFETSSTPLAGESSFTFKSSVNEAIDILWQILNGDNSEVCRINGEGYSFWNKGAEFGETLKATSPTNVGIWGESTTGVGGYFTSDTGNAVQIGIIGGIGLYVNHATDGGIGSYVNGASVISDASGGVIAKENSAQLEVKSTKRGFLLPRMTTTQINAITSPANGLQVYNTDLNTICFFNGTAWQRVLTAVM